MKQKVVLSERLQAVADYVTRSNRVVDVGCDHGFVSIYLMLEGIAPHVIAMDVNRGPLALAKEHILEYGLEKYIETRLSDGVHELKSGEADSLITAGMGGRLMVRILEEGRPQILQMKELILQPQSELDYVRKYLRQNGYRIDRENAVFEDGKYYFIMHVLPNQPIASEQHVNPMIELEDRYGKQLILEKHPVLIAYLKYMKETYQTILKGMPEHSDNARKTEVVKEIEAINGLLDRMGECV